MGRNEGESFLVNLLLGLVVLVVALYLAIPMMVFVWKEAVRFWGLGG